MVSFPKLERESNVLMEILEASILFYGETINMEKYGIWKNFEQQVLRSKQLLQLKRIYSKPVSLYFHVSSILVLDLPCQSHFPTFSQYSSLLRLIVRLYFWFSFCHKMISSNEKSWRILFKILLQHCLLLCILLLPWAHTETVQIKEQHNVQTVYQSDTCKRFDIPEFHLLVIQPAMT